MRATAHKQHNPNIGIGRRMKQARLDASLTRVDAAARLGITYHALRGMERGSVRTPTWVLVELARIYCYPVGRLLIHPELLPEGEQVCNRY